MNECEGFKLKFYKTTCIVKGNMVNKLTEHQSSAYEVAFQQDNAYIHTSIVAGDWIGDSQTEKSVRPALSLNPRQ